MKAADLDDLEMRAAWSEDDPVLRVAVNFPFHAVTANESSSVV